MGKILIAITTLIIGIAIGAIGAMTLGAGAMAGLGAGAGLATGICSTVRAAQDEGVMTADQVDQVLNRAAKDLSAATGQPAGQEIVGSAEACEKVLARLSTPKSADR